MSVLLSKAIIQILLREGMEDPVEILEAADYIEEKLREIDIESMTDVRAALHEQVKEYVKKWKVLKEYG